MGPVSVEVEERVGAVEPNRQVEEHPATCEGQSEVQMTEKRQGSSHAGFAGFFGHFPLANLEQSPRR